MGEAETRFVVSRTKVEQVTVLGASWLRSVHRFETAGRQWVVATDARWIVAVAASEVVGDVRSLAELPRCAWQDAWRTTERCSGTVFQVAALRLWLSKHRGRVVLVGGCPVVADTLQALIHGLAGELWGATFSDRKQIVMGRGDHLRMSLMGAQVSEAVKLPAWSPA